MILSKEEYQTLVRALAELNNCADLCFLEVRFKNGATVRVRELEPAVRVQETHDGQHRTETYRGRAEFILAYDKEYGL